MPGYDAVFVGSGVNSLASAALLSRAGWRVSVLERNDRLGGAIRTVTDLTEPGFTHELLSSWHPLFMGSAAYAELADDLARHGLEYLNTEHPTGTLYPDGSAAFLSTSLEANVAEFERLAAGDGAAWKRQFEEFMGSAELSFGVLSTELWSLQGLSLARSAYRRLGRRGLLAFGGHDARERARLARGDLRLRRGARAARTLGAAHRPRARAGRLRVHDAGDRRAPCSSAACRCRRAAACGSSRRSRRSCARAAASCARAPTWSGSSSSPAGRPASSSSGGEQVRADRAVIASVTPTQLYGRLLDRSARARPRSRARRDGFRYGRAGMQIHLALSEPPRVGLERGRAALADRHRARHARARRRLARGQRGRPRAATGRGDDRRRPAVRGRCEPRARRARWIIWIQLQELPRHVRGDALGQIDVGDGSWTENAARGLRRPHRRAPGHARSRTSSARR